MKTLPSINTEFTNAIGLARFLTLALGLSTLNAHTPIIPADMETGSAEALEKYVMSRRADTVASALLESGVEFGTVESEPCDVIIEPEETPEAEIESDYTLEIDLAHDAEMAKAMGVACILIPCGHNSRDRLARCGVKVVEGLGELGAEA